MMKSRQEALFLTGLRALRNTLAAAVDQIDVILNRADDEIRGSAQGRKRGECPHPIASRESRAAMGHPNRFHCNTCGEDVEE